MSATNQRLLRRISDLVEADDELRDLLQRYRKLNVNLAKLIERGEPGAAALKALDAPVQRREVTDGLERFDAARHQVRLALFTLCQEEGTTISEIGRLLGISRQLASRLAAQAARAED
jgi:hypothetical protein